MDRYRPSTAPRYVSALTGISCAVGKQFVLRYFIFFFMCFFGSSYSYSYSYSFIWCATTITATTCYNESQRGSVYLTALLRLFVDIHTLLLVALLCTYLLTHSLSTRLHLGDQQYTTHRTAPFVYITWYSLKNWRWVLLATTAQWSHVSASRTWLEMHFVRLLGCCAWSLHYRRRSDNRSSVYHHRTSCIDDCWYRVRRNNKTLHTDDQVHTVTR